MYRFSSSTTVPDPAPLPPKSGVLRRSFKETEFLFESKKKGKVLTLLPATFLIPSISLFLNKSAYSSEANFNFSSLPSVL